MCSYHSPSSLTQGCCLSGTDKPWKPYWVDFNSQSITFWSSCQHWLVVYLRLTHFLGAKIFWGEEQHSCCIINQGEILCWVYYQLRLKIKSQIGAVNKKENTWALNLLVFPVRRHWTDSCNNIFTKGTYDVNFGVFKTPMSAVIRPVRWPLWYTGFETQPWSVST